MIKHYFENVDDKKPKRFVRICAEIRKRELNNIFKINKYILAEDYIHLFIIHMNNIDPSVTKQKEVQNTFITIRFIQNPLSKACRVINHGYNREYYKQYDFIMKSTFIQPSEGFVEGNAIPKIDVCKFFSPCIKDMLNELDKIKDLNYLPDISQSDIIRYA